MPYIPPCTSAQPVPEQQSWPLKQIIREERNKVLVEWEGVDEEGMKWPVEWIPKKDLIFSYTSTTSQLTKQENNPKKGAAATTSTAGEEVRKAGSGGGKSKTKKKDAEPPIAVFKEEDDPNSLSAPSLLPATSTPTRISSFSLLRTEQDLNPSLDLAHSPPPAASLSRSPPLKPDHPPSSPFLPLPFSSSPAHLSPLQPLTNLLKLENMSSSHYFPSSDGGETPLLLSPASSAHGSPSRC